MKVRSRFLKVNWNLFLTFEEQRVMVRLGLWLLVEVRDMVRIRGRG